jgi:DNA-directed RNA polymerase subunit RPC12/RpoP
MKLEFCCSNCTSTIKSNSELEGLKIRCKQCGEQMIIPAFFASQLPAAENNIIIPPLSHPQQLKLYLKTLLYLLSPQIIFKPRHIRLKLNQHYHSLLTAHICKTVYLKKINSYTQAAYQFINKD